MLIFSGVSIKQYDYSEPQQGKSYCDCKIAHMRNKMRTYVASGHNIMTPGDMKQALDANSGVTGCQVAVVHIDRSKQTLTTHKWKGVNAVTNISFTDSGIRVYKAFGIGSGQFIPNEQLILYSKEKQEEGGLVVDEDFLKPKRVHGIISKPKTEPIMTTPNIVVAENETTDELHVPSVAGETEDDSVRDSAFCCPEMECTKRFMTYKGMDKHVLIGKHNLALQKESSYDKIRTKWSNYCNNLNISVFSQRDNSLTTQFSSETCLPKGWALKKEKSGARLDGCVKDYLLQCFNKGELTEQKANAKDVANSMKYIKDSDGNPLFSPNQWLQPSQVVSFFSRLSCLKRTDAKSTASVIKKVEPGVGDDDLDAVVAAIEAETIRQHVESLL